MNYIGVSILVLSSTTVKLTSYVVVAATDDVVTAWMLGIFWRTRQEHRDAHVGAPIRSHEECHVRRHQDHGISMDSG